MPRKPLLRSEFNDFLFAPIGDERNGMLLSVLSAMVRLDMDPWEEAARLTRLPQKQATQSLCAMIEELPAGEWSLLDSQVIAARLVQLLPSGAIQNPFRLWPLTAFKG